MRISSSWWPLQQGAGAHVHLSAHHGGCAAGSRSAASTQTCADWYHTSAKFELKGRTVNAAHLLASVVSVNVPLVLPTCFHCNTS